MSETPVAVVTGASQGIGRAITLELAARGWHTIGLARNEGALAELAERANGEYQVCDVSKYLQVERAAARIGRHHRQIDLLVLNAGVAGLEPGEDFLSSDPEAITQAMQTNHFGSVWCLRAFHRALKSGAPSDVLAIASVASLVVPPEEDLRPYADSKAAQLSFIRGARPLLAKDGIRTHVLMPGYIETPVFAKHRRLPRFLNFTVRTPEQVAQRALKMVDRNQAEAVMPAWYYGPIVKMHGLAPSLVQSAGRLICNFQSRG